MPFGIGFTLAFFVLCVLLTPLAWVKITVHKILLVKRTGHWEYALHALIYFFAGLPILLLTAIVDSGWFFVHIFQWRTNRVQEKSNFPKISLKAFNRFYYTINQKLGSSCNAKELVLEIRNQYRTTECIFGVLYANKTSVIDEKAQESAREN